jgi:hypothetical protein
MRGPKNPDTAPQAFIDRFSERAGTLQIRSAANGLPGPNEPVDFDRAPFVTQGLTARGEPVRYYNFTVPRDYVPNTVTSLAEIQQAGYAMETTRSLVNCPIVPHGSTARVRRGGQSSALMRGWYRGEVVSYFTFEERTLQTTSAGGVPVSPIYVTFNENPDQPNGGPASGFVTEQGTEQTHNVVQTVPADAAYSPLWLVTVYDNRDFANVRDLRSALQANILAAGVALVNCPVVWLGDET